MVDFDRKTEVPSSPRTLNSCTGRPLHQPAALWGRGYTGTNRKISNDLTRFLANSIDDGAHRYSLVVIATDLLVEFDAAGRIGFVIVWGPDNESRHREPDVGCNFVVRGGRSTLAYLGVSSMPSMSRSCETSVIVSQPEEPEVTCCRRTAHGRPSRLLPILRNHSRSSECICELVQSR